MGRKNKDPDPWFDYSATKKVEHYLERQGYPLEFHTLHSFREHGFEAEHSVRLPPDENGKRREIDVLARIQHHNSPIEEVFEDYIFSTVRYVVECKTSKLYPWVVFFDEGSESEQLYKYGDRILSEGAQLALFRGGLPNSESGYFSRGLREGTNVTTAVRMEERKEGDKQGEYKKNTGDSAFYSAVENCVERALQLDAQFVANTDFSRSLIDEATVTIPLIVLDGKLTSLWYDKSSKSCKVEELGVARVRFAPPNSDRCILVEVVTKDALDDFLSTRKREADTICEFMLDRCFHESQKILKARAGAAGESDELGEFSGFFINDFLPEPSIVNSLTRFYEEQLPRD